MARAAVRRGEAGAGASGRPRVRRPAPAPWPGRGRPVPPGPQTEVPRREQRPGLRRFPGAKSVHRRRRVGQKLRAEVGVHRQGLDVWQGGFGLRPQIACARGFAAASMRSISRRGSRRPRPSAGRKPEPDPAASPSTPQRVFPRRQNLAQGDAAGALITRCGAVSWRSPWARAGACRSSPVTKNLGA